MGTEETEKLKSICGDVLKEVERREPDDGRRDLYAKVTQQEVRLHEWVCVPAVELFGGEGDTKDEQNHDAVRTYYYLFRCVECELAAGVDGFPVAMANAEQLLAEAFEAKFSPEELETRRQTHPLTTVGRSFLRWHAVVDQERAVEWGCPENVLSRDMTHAVSEVEQRMARSFPGAVAGDKSTEDACQWAWLRLRELMHECDKGYLYRSRLPSWLYPVARYKFVDWLRKAQREARTKRAAADERTVSLARAESEGGPIPLLVVVDEPKQIDEGLVIQRLARRRERFMLLLYTFKLRSHEAVKEIHDEFVKGLAGVVLGFRSSSKTRGDPRHDTSRHRLRQKLAVLEFVLDRVPAGHPDKPGDESMLGHLKDTHGYASTDIPGLRKLACLARAARGEASLAWALYSKLLTNPDGVKPEDARDIVLDVLTVSARCNLIPASIGTWNERLDAVLHSFEADEESGTLGRAKKSAQAGEFLVLFLVPATWYLLRDRGARGDEEAYILGTLKPSKREEPHVVEIIQCLL